MKHPIALFITDTHLSESNSDVVKSVFNQTILKAKEFGFTEIFHLGDIFHSRKGQTQEVLSVFDDILDTIEENGLILRVISGNHDRSDYSSWKSFLKGYKKHPGIDLILHSEQYKLSEGVTLQMIPFFEDEIFIEKFNEVKKPKGRVVLGIHQGIQGATTNSGLPIESALTSNHFREYDLVLVGHYHDQQQFENINYIGASIQHNFGESSTKGATLLYDDLSLELIPFEFPKYLTFEVDVNAITLKDIADIKEEKKTTGNFIRTIITGKEKDVKSFAHKQELINAGVKVEIREDKIIKEDLESRIEPFNDISLGEEFIAFCEKNNFDISVGKKYLDKVI